MELPRLALCLLFVTFTRQLTADTQGRFANPLFRGQDPWVTQWNGSYYYSESDGASIRIRTSATLTGLAQAAARVVWTASYPMTNLWAPEVHFEDGRWYIYYSADQRSDRHHRLYVLQGGADPFDAYTPGDTGVAGGLLPESTGRWGIDADVFRGPDHSLYLTWSCAESSIGDAPQSICLARMADPVHFASKTLRIATPDRAWERRTAAIEEGPVGFTRDGLTYITYSGSSSWMTNDYSVGLLVHTGGDLLDPSLWTKYGPILDRHAGTWGPGSVVFTPSPDGTEMWSVFHAYDQRNCPAWSCRSIRMQKARFAENSLPVIEYPLDPFATVDLPSGDAASPTGWGSAHSGTPASGDWVYTSATAAEIAAGDRAETFRGVRDLQARSVSARIVGRATGAGAKHGIYAVYQDSSNYMEVHVDPKRYVAGARVVVEGRELLSAESRLPRGYDLSSPHAWKVEQGMNGAFSFALDGQVLVNGTSPLTTGQIGLIASATSAIFEEVEVRDISFGWTEPVGAWQISTNSAISQSPGAIYRGNPNFSDYAVSARVTLPQQGGGAGLIAGHIDQDNSVTLWLNPDARTVDAISLVGGAESREPLAILPGAGESRVRRLTITKDGTLFSFFVDELLVGQRSFELANGKAGLIATSAGVRFEDFRLSSELLLPSTSPPQPVAPQRQKHGSPYYPR